MNNLSADTILCQNCSVCKGSKDVNRGQFDILGTSNRGKPYITNIGKLKEPEEMLQMTRKT
jgi:hypothetical protein